MSRSVLRLGTRKSPMALAQSGQVAGLITARTGRRVELADLPAGAAVGTGSPRRAAQLRLLRHPTGPRGWSSPHPASPCGNGARLQ